MNRNQNIKSSHQHLSTPLALSPPDTVSFCVYGPFGDAQRGFETTNGIGAMLKERMAEWRGSKRDGLK
jgi:hypothetical protein